MRNAPLPNGMVTALLLSIVVKKECIVNAFNILSTPIRRTKYNLPLVENAFFLKKNTKRKATLMDCLSFFVGLV